jgi:porphobilinogen deaminase
MASQRPIFIATRGSALALAQANVVLAECRANFPKLNFELKIIKTSGDKLQSASMARIDATLPRGLFTKELEVALIKGRADMAVHSLKDLPTDLPSGLKLGAVGKRADVRDVLIYRDAEFLKAQLALPAAMLEEWSAGHKDRRGFKPHTTVADLPTAASIATSSTRRKAQLLAVRPDIKVVDIRGNITTRMEKLANQAELDGLILALAGLSRLNFQVTTEGRLIGDAVPEGLLATILEIDQMLPCVGQGAIGIEIRAHDERIAALCERLNHFNTFQCVTAERAFLHAMGGGCQTPIGAYAQVIGEQIFLRGVSFLGDKVKRGDAKRPLRDPVVLGEQLAAQLR